MKLNYKRTILVGFAFFLICAFWQAYDATIPVILTNKFGMSQTWSGVIMALDNILAVFMLPIFGALSDKYAGKKTGKRTPFIMVGTIIAAVVLVALSFVDAAQLKNISDISKIDDVPTLGVIYDKQTDKVLTTPDGDLFVLSDKYEEDMLNTIKYINKLDIQGIKIHMLSILKDTPIEYMYQRDKFHILTKEEYIDITISQLELLRPEIVIHRITGDPKLEDLIEPQWLVKKFCVLNDIDKEMVKRDTYQGSKL